MFPSLLSGIVRAEVGEDGYARLVAARTSHLGRGDLTYAVEASHNEGPFEHPEDSQRYNGWFVIAGGLQATKCRSPRWATTAPGILLIKFLHARSRKE